MHLDRIIVPCLPATLASTGHAMQVSACVPRKQDNPPERRERIAYTLARSHYDDISERCRDYSSPDLQLRASCRDQEGKGLELSEGDRRRACNLGGDPPKPVLVRRGSYSIELK
jgi:hypothetical protein